MTEREAKPVTLPADIPQTLKLDYVPQLWRAKAGAELRDEANLDAPVVTGLVEGTGVFTVGAGRTGVDPKDWHLAVAGDPERLFYVLRDHLTPLSPTPRDPELYEGIAAVVNGRLAGKSVRVTTD